MQEKVLAGPGTLSTVGASHTALMAKGIGRNLLRREIGVTMPRHTSLPIACPVWQQCYEAFAVTEKGNHKSSHFSNMLVEASGTWVTTK